MAKVHKNIHLTKRRGMNLYCQHVCLPIGQGTVCIECSQDGEHFTQMRVCHMHQGGGKIRFGIYACLTKKSYERHI